MDHGEQVYDHLIQLLRRTHVVQYVQVKSQHCAKPGLLVVQREP